MRGVAILTAISLATACGASAWARPNGVPGVMTEDGAFHPLVASPAATATSTPTAGTLILKLSIEVTTKTATSSPIHCQLSANLIDGTGAYESDVVVATKAATGTGYVCMPTIPYLWYLQQASGSVSLSYTITALDTNGLGRTSSTAFAYIAVPANGAVTHFEINGRI